MTTFQQLDAALTAKGWSYSVEYEQFTDGYRRLDYRRALALVPGMTLDELASYQDDKWDRSPRAKKVRAAYWAAAKRLASVK